MKVNIGAFAHNSKDWERVHSGDYSRPPATPDYEFVQRALALADLAEPLGFDGIWAPEHQGTPYGMTPNPIQTLTYFAGRTKRISLGSMVVVAPWWHPVRLAHQIAYLDIVSNGRYDNDRAWARRFEIGVRRGWGPARGEPASLRRNPRYPETGSFPGAVLLRRKNLQDSGDVASPRAQELATSFRVSMALLRRAIPSKYSPVAGWCRCSLATSRLRMPEKRCS